MKRLSKFLDDNPDAQKSFDWAVFIVAGLCIMALLFYPERAFGATREWRTEALSVLSGDAYGGCMVLVRTMNSNLNCRKGAQTGWWLSLDCEGEYGSTANARESMEQATLAVLTKKKLSVRVDDRETVDGYCVAQQTILWR